MPVPGIEGVIEKQVFEDDSTSTTEDAGGNGGIKSNEASTDNQQSRTIQMTADNWSFSPSTFTVKKGESVTLHVASTTGTHGIAIPGLGISQMVVMGNSADIQISTDKPGTYEFFCSVPCGSGHKDMRGAIIIEE